MAKEAKDAPIQPAPEKARVDVKKFVKIGRPGYRGEWEGHDTISYSCHGKVYRRVTNCSTKSQLV